jgi:hypothetical protein
MVSVPLAAATVVGANTTEIVQLAAGVAQVVLATPNTGTSTFGMSATRAPVLVMVTANAGLICPTSTSAKLSAAGTTLSAGNWATSGPDTVASGTDPPLSGAAESGTDVLPPALLSWFTNGAGLLLPPQPTPARIPTSPKQVAWSNRSNLL